MTPILAEFNHHFVRGSGATFLSENLKDPKLLKWIFLHGLMGFGLNLRSIAAGLPSHCVSLLFDQRGHGKSIKPPHGYAPEDYAQDVERWRQYLNWDQIFLFGHSMGGRNAMAYAYRYPQHCRALIIEDIGPDARPEAVNYYQQLLNSIPTPFPSKQAAKEWLLNDFLQTPFGQKGGTVLGQYLYTNLVETSSGNIDWRFDKKAIMETIQLGRGQDYWQVWKEIRVPILIIRGGRSTDLDEKTFNQMLATNPLASGVTIPQAGHWVHFDQPAAVIAALVTLIDKVMKPS